MSDTGTTVTFSTGITLNVRRVSPMTIRQVEASIPVPQPPMQQTELGPEPNYSHPDYGRALVKRAEQVGNATLDTLIVFGVDLDTSTEDVQTALAQLRTMAARVKLVLPDDDLVCYVKHVAIGDTEDLTLLRDALLSASMPKEKRVTERMNGFKSEVQGEGHSAAESA